MLVMFAENGFVEETENGFVEETEDVFQEIVHQNAILWGAMHCCYAQNGDLIQAKSLFDRMPLHSMIMIKSYAQKGDADQGKQLFEAMPHRDLVSWNSIIAVYAQRGRFKDAIRAFSLCCCWDSYSWNTILVVYALDANICEAKKTFDRIPTWNFVSWNTMLAAYAQTGHAYSAIQLFWAMFLHGFDPDKAAFAIVLTACSYLGLVKEASSLVSDALPYVMLENIFRAVQT
ncbi:pentatricopeptide repeat-containing protein At2g35030, mitochondrial-like [Selaginella moellendorffii]|uniref:pentatricopeptide repeat-containing protein At2g35030, mitochondrial-like n=1 Tax=Selaginella moellendorffii TaxID=88036 RepID=UPI000D1CF6F2|nr:pentatricopeptide repeat-containing protein At2g35030, mitochondrial-like [Selaginella moellendorffii]|eukprot:XP_024523676.1 pentatricopeptide repeat-containing protein At2g35030, mitochondrial-like [Selaginella moellendorffii]